MQKDSLGLTIQMDVKLHDRFQYVAAYEGRSMSKQVLQLISACIREFEKEHGPITDEDLKKNAGT